ncbi:CBS domain-containing protein [Rubrolithibacter danxiaensis]|uniref:CBS domain-containing protein n=1 Tax=Rubrolithibacter danxiaensis TaxID=3390805 RepID=UPI003BF79544
MVARELLSDSIPPLKTSDSVQKVFDRMAEFRVSHLPIVDDKQFLGLISDEDIIEVPDYQTAVGELTLSLNNVCVNAEQHIYDAIRTSYEKKLSVIPVLDEQKNYLGLISLNSLVEYMATLTSVKEPGGIIVLEISSRENSLSHISQIVESNNAQILSSYIQSFADSTRLEVTLKVNLLDLTAIVASFQRYNYIVKETFQDIKADTGHTDRYDQLMNYLGI